VTPTISRIKLVQAGVVGLGVMAQNLALNHEDHGRRVAVWNLESAWDERIVSANGSKRIVCIAGAGRNARIPGRGR
jgi:6-phosphogluconate dehydrogenase